MRAIEGHGFGPKSPSVAARVVLAALAVSAHDGQAQPSLSPVPSCASSTNTPLLHPVPDPVIVGFGLRLNPLTGRTLFHNGIDYAVVAGEIVRAAGLGRVVSIERHSPGDMAVTIDHGRGLTTRYAHLGGIQVTAGACVAAEQPLGAIGGRPDLQAPWLHVELRRDGSVVDPLRVFRPVRRPAQIGSHRNAEEFTPHAGRPEDRAPGSRAGDR